MSQNTITVKARDNTGITTTTEDIEFQEKRKQDILLLLNELALREEVAISLILECIYDIGAINLINKKVKSGVFKRLTKYLARLSKPLFTVIAFRWFKKNCPQLITNWLCEKVS